jgi:hypothetical protein
MESFDSNIARFLIMSLVYMSAPLPAQAVDMPDAEIDALSDPVEASPASGRRIGILGAALLASGVLLATGILRFNRVLRFTKSAK